MLSGQVKVICLSPFFSRNKLFLYDIFMAPNMSASQALMWSIDMWVYLASWLFSHILSSQCFHLFVYYYCPPLCHLKFFVCIPAHFLADGFLLFVHHECSGCHYYCCGWPWLSMIVDCFNMVQDGIQWINLFVYMFFCLVTYVLLCCYHCQPDMLSVTCNSSPHCCNLYVI